MKQVSEAGLIGMREFCDHVQLHPMTAYRLCKQGKIPFVKIGSDYRFKLEWVDKMMEEAMKEMRR